MKPETLNVSNSGSPNYLTQLLGLACQVISRSPYHSKLDFHYVQSTLIPAIMHRQLQIFFDENEAPVAYIVWASVVDEVEARFVTEKKFRLHESEWNEGEILWVIDLAAKTGYFASVKNLLTKTTFRNVFNIRYMRMSQGRMKLREFRKQAGGVGNDLKTGANQTGDAVTI